MYIKVDYCEFDKAISVIDSRIETLKGHDKSVNNEINSLSSYWQGEDYEQFMLQWSQIQKAKSSLTQMISFLESYSRFLKYSKRSYKLTQEEALKRASRL